MFASKIQGRPRSPRSRTAPDPPGKTSDRMRLPVLSRGHSVLQGAPTAAHQPLATASERETRDEAVVEHSPGSLAPAQAVAPYRIETASLSDGETCTVCLSPPGDTGGGGAAPGRPVLAGGQSLVPIMNFRLARPTYLIDINAVAGLDRLAAKDGVLRTGAWVRHAAFGPPVERGPLGRCWRCGPADRALSNPCPRHLLRQPRQC